MAEAVVELAGRRLSSRRPEWGQAMAAELASLTGRGARLRFALGCAGTAIAPPVGGAEARSIARLLMLAALAVFVGLGLMAWHQESLEPATGRYGPDAGLVIVFAVLVAIGWHGWLVDRRLREGSSQAQAARRWGIPAGVVLGGLALAASVPALVPSPFFGGLLADVTLPALALAALATGIVAARSSQDRGAAADAGVWAGRVAGWILAVGLLAGSLWASGWFVHSAVTTQAFRDTLPSGHSSSYHTHFHTIAGFVLSENIDYAVGSALLLFPLVGLAFGYLGGFLGRAGRCPDRAPRPAGFTAPPGQG